MPNSLTNALLLTDSNDKCSYLLMPLQIRLLPPIMFLFVPFVAFCINAPDLVWAKVATMLDAREYFITILVPLTLKSVQLSKNDMLINSAKFV